MRKDKLYKVTMWNPMSAFVTAKNKEDAIDKATDADEWEAPHYSGEEKYQVEVVKKEDLK